MRFLRGRAQSQGQAYLTERIKARLEAEEKARTKKIVTYAAIASVVPFLSLTVLVVVPMFNFAGHRLITFARSG